MNYTKLLYTYVNSAVSYITSSKRLILLILKISYNLYIIFDYLNSFMCKAGYKLKLCGLLHY